MPEQRQSTIKRSLYYLSLLAARQDVIPYASDRFYHPLSWNQIISF